MSYASPSNWIVRNDSGIEDEMVTICRHLAHQNTAV
jgi:hypothetical protein